MDDYRPVGAVYIVCGDTGAPGRSTCEHYAMRLKRSRSAVCSLPDLHKRSTLATVASVILAIVAGASLGRPRAALAQETQLRDANQGAARDWDVRNNPPGPCGARGELASSGSITTTDDGQIIENLDVDGRIEVRHKNVIIRNCDITGDQYYAIVLMPDKYPNASFCVEYCTVRGSINAIAGVGRVYRCDLSKCDNGVNVWGMTTIEECFIHDLGFSVGGHNDGIENNGSAMTVRECRIIASRENDTSAIMTNNEFGKLQDILIEGNYLEGGQYTLYCDTRGSTRNMPVANFVVRNNIIKRGRYGFAAMYNSGVVIDLSNKIL